MRTKVILPLLSIGVATIVGLANAPASHALAAPTSGNAGLITAAQAQYGAKQKSMSIALIDTKKGTVKYANFGATTATEYEIGSISKTFVGMLMADSITRKEVSESTTLSTLLPLNATSPSGKITLAELASHRSGLPTMPSTPGMIAQSLQYQFFGANLVPFTQSQLLTQTRATTKLPKKGAYQYSNMGGSLEGHALAAAAKTNYKTLLQNRMLTPLGLNSTRILSSTADVTAQTTRGYSSAGKKMAPFAGEGYAPAASMRSTVGDMAKYAYSVARNQAPGSSSTIARWSAAPGQQVGYNWFIDSKGRVWHNGKTGGFASMLKIDRASGRAIVVLSNTAVVVDAGADALLENTAL